MSCSHCFERYARVKLNSDQRKTNIGNQTLYMQENKVSQEYNEMYSDNPNVSKYPIASISTRKNMNSYSHKGNLRVRSST